MKMKSIQINNFKGFTNRTFQFNDQFSLLIGDNNTGKTSILEALAVGMGGFLAGLDSTETRTISKDEIRKKTQLLGDATVIPKYQFPVEISCSVYINGEEFVWKRSKSKLNGRTKTETIKQEITDYAQTLHQQITSENNQNTILPVIAYYSEIRMGSQKREKWRDPFKESELSRFLGYTDCLAFESNIKLFIRWFRRMSSIKLQKNKKIGELDAVLNAIQTCLTGINEGNQDISIHYDFENEEIMVNYEDDEIPLRLMSAGYRSMIGMVADLAYRMALLNPQLKENATKETPGIVLIDEIDLHLHPKWQWRIISDLKRAFPKVHFIATTHAPIVIASCEEHEIIRLYEENGEIISDTPKTPSGWLIENVLTEIMDADARSPEIEAKIQRIHQLFRKKIKNTLTAEEFTEMKNLAIYIESILPEDDPAVLLTKLDAIKNDVYGSESNA